MHYLHKSCSRRSDKTAETWPTDLTGRRRIRGLRLSDMQPLDLMVLAVVLLVTFRGFIDNFLGYGTVLVDIWFAALLVWSIFAVVTGRVCQRRGKLILYCYLCWWVLCLLTAFFQVISGRTTLYDAAIGVRNNNIYTLLFFVIALRMDGRGVRLIYHVFVNCGVLICVFAIVQFLLRNVLPESLLVLNGEDVFGLYGTDLIRVTGLMGNTIIFGGYAIILFALVWAELVYTKFSSPLLLGKLIIIAAANFLTFSRASVVGMVVIAFAQFILYGCTHRKARKYLAISAAALCVLAVFVVVFFWDSTIIQRLFNLNSDWTEGSDAGHFQMICDALVAVGQNWVFGRYLGDVSTVITDGAIWTYLVEWGVPTFLVYALLILMLCIFALRKCKSRNPFTASVANGFFGMCLYMVGFSLINSAYNARSVLVFFWMIAGMLFVADTERKSVPLAMPAAFSLGESGTKGGGGIASAAAESAHGMDVSIIMINYNTFDLTRAAIESIFAQTKGISYEVILVDNASPDGSGEKLRALFEGKIFYLQAGGNLGTSRSFNLGLARAKGKYILWLNPDILIKENFVKKLFDYMEQDSACGICGGNILDFEGKPAHSFRKELLSLRRERRDKSIFVALWRKLFCRPFAGEYNYTDRPMQVGYITGADMMVRRSVFDKVGGFDEDIFMYAEEVEFTYRAVHRTHCTVVCVPDAHIYHLEGASFEKARFNEWKFTTGMTGSVRCYAKCLGEEVALKFLKLLRRSYRKFAIICTLLFYGEGREIYRRKYAIADKAVREFPAILKG